MLRRDFIKRTSALAAASALIGKSQLEAANNQSISYHDAEFDLVILMATPAGIMAAIAAARLGKKSLILERTSHIGGLPANGLGATDLETRGATAGLYAEFAARIAAYYAKTYGAESKQVKDCSSGFHFEPSVAERIFQDMLNEHQGISVFLNHQFDAAPENLIWDNAKGLIKGISVTNRLTGEKKEFTGKVFLDCSYEGDLIDAAGIEFYVGREDKSLYNEIGAGRVYRYWKGDFGLGTTGQGDNAIQAYNYRLCLTNNPANRVPITRPDNFDPREYESLIDDVLTGRHTGVQLKDISEAELAKNKENTLKSGTLPDVPGVPKGLWRIVNRVGVPNGKSDSNNQHYAFISTDLPEENWPWPTLGWEWRDKFAQRLKDYTLGLLFFAQNDPRLPEVFKKEIREWGLAADEYTDNNNFPRQVYVREGRRMKGLYLFKAQDALPFRNNERPEIHKDSITASHYSLDSHACRKREPNRVHLEGFFNIKTKPYTVPFRVMVPQAKVGNLLAPVPVSGTHVGFSTLRMEPCWMAMGQAAGIASALAIKSNTEVGSVNTTELQEELLNQNAVLVYIEDLPYSDPDHKAFQKAALAGLFTQFKVNPDARVPDETLKSWKRLTGKKPPKGETLTTRAIIRAWFA